MSLHRPTVHDLSSLSLHPTGARAKREETNVVQDARGNLIAKDAAGWSRVVRRRREKEEEEEEEEEEKEMMVKGKAKDISPDDYLEMYVNQPKGMRAHKRRRIAHDVDFLQSRENDGNNLDLPTPSSDLLKQIHHFASHYYAAHDLLFDSKREYRKARKEKKDKKKKKAKPREQGREREEEENTDIEEDTDSVDEAESGKEDEGSEDGEEEDKSKPQPKRRGKKGEKKTLRRNMYKVFDGSALMTLGMLLQHYTASLLTPTAREGWEEEMEKYVYGMDTFRDEVFGEGRMMGGKKKRKGGSESTGKHADVKGARVMAAAAENRL